MCLQSSITSKCFSAFTSIAARSKLTDSYSLNFNPLSDMQKFVADIFDFLFITIYFSEKISLGR